MVKVLRRENKNDSPIVTDTLVTLVVAVGHTLHCIAPSQ